MNKKTVKRSPLTKLSLVAKSEGMGIDELDKFCAENGISFSELQSWRDLALSAMENSGNGEVVSAKFHEQETAKLQAELNRKDKTLADNRGGYRAKRLKSLSILRPRKCPELVAKGPNEVWCWDITWLH